jgi:hypothetical protein
MEKRDVWCLGLQGILGDAGKQTEVEDQEIGESMSPTASSPGSTSRQVDGVRRAAILASSNESITKLITTGARFSVYRGDRRFDALVFYSTRPQDGACGTLYWCDYSANKNKNTEQQAGLQLAQISSVVLGRQTRDFMSLSARDAVETRCISFITSTGQELNMEASSPEQMSTWLFAIHRILVSAGREIVLDEVSLMSLGSPHF